MRFLSFNINGIRARIHQLEAIIITLQPDVIGLQETKVDDSMFPFKEIVHFGYYTYCYGQKGHYGVAILSRKKPLAVRRGFSIDALDIQRRIIMADFFTSKGVLTVINGYFPQGENRNNPLKFLIKERFYLNLQNYIEKKYNPRSLLIIMGDMNISPTDFDIGIGEKNRYRWLRSGKCSFLPEERIWLNRLLSWGLVDTYRYLNPINDYRYSWFDYRSHGFNENRGLRIDLLLASKSLVSVITATGIDYNIRAMDKSSDHAPVWTDFSL